jgi:hypothetical protein
LEANPEGAINNAHTHTPMAQLIDMSAEERRRMILTIKGILKNGMRTAATKPIFSTMFIAGLSGI